ncbi:hypothetical protein Tco_1192172 [Tanacetum coccineum]
MVPAKERVKTNTTNVRLETIVPQKEETFQVIIDVIKNSTCYKAFTISTEVPKIFMQQFWYTVKKVSSSNSYEFLLANKKCVVDAEVFWKILDICPRVQGVDFAEVPDDEATLTFLFRLGYKGPLHKHPSMENVDYLELSREDFAFQIDYSRRENMPYPKFTKIIINHFLSKHQSLTKLQYLHTHTINDDGIASRLKFVRIGKDYQEYRLPIPETMLTDGIKKSESYHIRLVKKKVTITADDNIILDPNVALELGKSISLTKAAEEEAARQVHATHARIVTEPVPEPARRRPLAIAFRDTSSMSKKKSSDPSQKLKGIQTLTPEEKLVADTMKALKESKKTSRRQPGTGGLSEGTGVSPGVPDESTVVPATSSEGTGTKKGFPMRKRLVLKIMLYLSEDLNDSHPKSYKSLI